MQASPSPAHTQLLEPAQVAALLYIDLATVSRWAEGGRLTPVDTPDGRRRYTQADVLRLMVDVKQTKKHVAAGRLSAESGAVSSIRATDAALDVTLTVEAVKAAEALASEAAARARLDRAAASRAAAALVADDAAQTAVATRFRAEVAAQRVREAAEREADSQRMFLGGADAVAAQHAARTAPLVEAAAVALAKETATLAEAVARTVAMTAELVAATFLALDEAIEAEVAATAAAVELRVMAAAHLAAVDVATRQARS
jgi:hypothetical protein